MADLNYLRLGNIFGKIAVATLTTTAANVITNSVNSNSLVKLNTVFLCNVDNTLASHATVYIQRSGSARLEYLSRLLPIRYNSTIKLVSRDTSHYLQEGDVLVMMSNVNNKVESIVSYELIS
jgi:hypothetical protein